MSKISTARLDWQTDKNGLTVPISADFGDVYFCKENGLAESRYVFIEQNQLTERFAKLNSYQRFVIGEIGFGTGLNFLATWQLWQTIIDKNPNLANAHLHFISTEKFPLTQADLAKALSVWHELAPFAKPLIANYPPPLAGCHRLSLSPNVTLDIWLGDATDSLSQLTGTAKIDAWFLDGFAPSCNDELWSNNLFNKIKRLSKANTTLSTFSVANIVKQNLLNHDFILKKVKGFGKKREMLTAIFSPKQSQINFAELKFRYNKKIKPYFVSLPFTQHFETAQRNRKKLANKSKKSDFYLPNLPKNTQKMSIAVIGAGVAGLTTAYALASRGHDVTIFDKDKPLSGASGNVRAFLAPKLTSLTCLATNLHAIGFLASCRSYPTLSEQTGIEILQTTGCLDLLSHNRLELDEVQNFPSEFATLLTEQQAKNLVGYDVGQAIFLPKAGLIDTAKFAKAVLSHTNISFKQLALNSIAQQDNKVTLNFANFNQVFDHVVLCTALATCDFLPKIKRFNHSRGQVSWCAIDKNTQAKMPKLPLKYGSYFANFSQKDGEYSQNFALLGASFIRDTFDTTPQRADHDINVQDFLAVVPSLKDTIKVDKNWQTAWQGRASLRCQTVDYLPLVGQVGEPNSRIWTFSALGSKGYAYAPICSELLAGLICGEMLPLGKNMVAKLSPNRKVLNA